MFNAFPPGNMPKFLDARQPIIDHSRMTARQATFRTAMALLILLAGFQLGALHERSQPRVRIGGEPGLVSPGASASGVTVQDPQRQVDMSLVWEVWEELNSHYIDPQKVQVTPLVYGAAEGLVRGLGDPYTVFMTPKENESFREGLAGNLEGIGAELALRDGLVMIVTPIKGSPAERAGLQPKDAILEVDGQSVEGWSLGNVVSHIRGPKGTPVKLRIGREASALTGGPLEFTIIREAIHIPSVESHLIETEGKTFGYAALNQFGESSITEMRKELESFKSRGVDGLILDLRNNGGGYLDGAVELASLFLSQGTVVTVEHRQGSPDTQQVNGRVLFPDTPLVVLQNEATASASEIVAGALQDYGRATVVGEKSFGKGTVQEVLDLPGGASLRVTVARWLTPKGKNLGKEGVHPDVDIAPRKPTDTPPDVGAPWDWKIDPQLTAGVEVLLGRKPAGKQVP